MYYTPDITLPAASIVWTQIPGAPANACAVRVADTAGQAGTPTFFVQAGICNNPFQGHNPDQLWRTTGLTGASWTRIDNLGGLTGGIGVFAVDPSNSDRLYASNIRTPAQGGPRMVFSNNAGTVWTADADLDDRMTGNGVFQYPRCAAHLTSADSWGTRSRRSSPSTPRTPT